MVLDDMSLPPKESKSRRFSKQIEREALGRLHEQLASPMDRLAALMGDCIVFAPILALALAPLKRGLFEAELVGGKDQWALLMSLMTFVTVLSWILYQTFFIGLLGWTPGKYILGLRVVSLWGNGKPKLLPALYRSLTWVFEVACLALPMLSVYSNERRRPLHDRVADTVVVSQKKKIAVGPPGPAETSIVGGFFASLLLVLSIFIFSIVNQMISRLSVGESDSTGILTEGAVLCPTVGEVQGEWVSGGRASPSRLEVAMALYESDVIGETCLQQEAEYSLWNHREMSLGYLANAFANAENNRLYENYLTKSCSVDPSSDACHLVQLLRMERERDPEMLESEPTSNDFIERRLASVNANQQVDQIEQNLSTRAPEFLKIWMIRNYVNNQEYDKAYHLLSVNGAPHRQLGYFYAKERAKVLWAMGRMEESRLIVGLASEAQDKLGRVQLSSWLCSAETMENGCGPWSRRACDQLLTTIISEKPWALESDVEVSLVRGMRCQMHEQPNSYDNFDWEERLSSEDGKELVHVIEKWKTNSKMGLKALRKLANEKHVESPFYPEIQGVLAEWSDDPKEIIEMKGQWLRAQPDDEGWRFLGKKLLDRFVQFKDWENVLQVGLKLVDFNQFDQSIYRQLVVAAYRSGDQRLAVGFLDNLEQFDDDEVVDSGKDRDGKVRDLEFEKIFETLTRLDMSKREAH